MAQKVEKLLQRRHFIENQSPQFYLTLSWRRPLSYRNQSLLVSETVFHMITASLMKELISCIYWYFSDDINYMKRLYVVNLKICFYWKTYSNKTPSWKLCSFTKLLNTSKPANIYLFKVKKRNTRKRCKICSELTIKTPERRQRRHPDVFIVNFEHYSHIF